MTYITKEYILFSGIKIVHQFADKATILRNKILKIVLT
jgi:hypothetical protein